MAITITQKLRDRLRRKLGNLTDTDLPDAEIDDLFAQAGEDYPGYANNQRVMFAAAKLYALKDLQTQAAKEVDYRQNQSDEKASQWFKHLTEMVAQAQKDLDMAIDDEFSSKPAPMWASMRKVPQRKEGRPRA